MLSSGRPRDVAGRRAARDADDRAARVRIPVRRAEAGEGRHEVDAAVVGHGRRERLDVGRLLDDAQAVAQPLHDRAADEHAALERVLGASAHRPARPSSAGGSSTSTGCVPVFCSRKQPVPYVFFVSPGDTHIWPNSAACWSPAMPAIGTSSTPSVVLTRRRRSRSTRAPPAACWPARRAAPAGRRPTSSVAMLNSIVREALLTSVTCVLPPVSFQISHESIVPKASSPPPRARARPATLSRIHATFVPGEVRVDDEAGALAHERLVAGRLEPVAELGGAPVLPDDGVVDRLAGLAVPDHRRLALVRDADGRDVARSQVRAAERLDGDARSASPRSPAGRARPSPASGRSAGTPAGRRRRRRRRGRRGWRASWWFPGRGRARRARRRSGVGAE